MSKSFQKRFAKRVQISSEHLSRSAVFLHKEGQKYILPLGKKDIRFMFNSLRHFITECDTCYYKIQEPFYYKMRHRFITKCISFFYYKMRHFCNKMRRLLQNATFLTKCVGHPLYLDFCIKLTTQNIRFNNFQLSTWKVFL